MDKLSDLELNVAITTALDIFIIVDDGEVMIPTDNPRKVLEPFDFNNWNDLMPLVVEHGISSVDYCNKGMWTAICDKHRLVINNENLQRALAECLLKVLQEKLI